ncbi:MFS domain-containing protein [Caerostris extrusa]|uniref:MFS domain-containing protein n=1 Tax=Caerostris extrusa TaxID=172846 RepID=A0AAV4VNW6_CAEEX|nr:MFS domain-containing protein [Caerostris extrusa]
METNALQELTFVKSCLMLDNPINISDCSYELKQNKTIAIDESAKWSKYSNTFLFFCTFLATFYVGSWSDRLGRKFPMLIPPIGTVIASSINAVLSYYIRWHPAYFLGSSFISGITFGSVGIIATTYGYISDFTHEQSRTKRIAILESMIFIGGTIGIFVAGAFLGHIDYERKLNNFVLLFIFEALLSATVVAYIIFRIPSYSTDNQSSQSPLSFSSLFSLKHVGYSLKTIFRSREDGKRKKILFSLVALCLIYLGTVVQLFLSFLYVKEMGWTFTDYSNFHSMQFAVEGFALVCIFPLLQRFPRIPDHFIGMLGLFSKCIGLTVFGLSVLSSQHDYMIYSCIALYMFSEFPVPALRSMLSKTVSPDEKGKIFAFTTILQNMCYLIAFLIMIYLYCTRRIYVTAYETIEHEDGSITEVCSVVSSEGSVNY